MTKPINWYARRYVERFGMHIVPIEPGRKFPRTDDWGNNTISDPETAEQFYTDNPDWNMGLVLGASNYCSLDIDCVDSFRLICEVYGIDLDALIQSAPTIKGVGCRIVFRVPEGMKLDYHRLLWKKQDDNKKTYTVFELRSAFDGKQRQDVLPPSIHPDTKMPYEWLTQPPKHNEKWAEPPTWLLALWQDWDKFKPQMQAMCPWSDLPPAPKPKSMPPVVAFNQDGNVIQTYLNNTPLESALSQYGYREVGKRWLSPHSSTGLPGFVLFEDGKSGWMHHASDPLCSDDSGRPVNAFDLYVQYEHAGDIKRAVRALSDQYGMRRAHAHVNKPTVTEDGEILPAVHDDTPSRDIQTLLPWTTDKGKPIKNIENLKEICRRLGVTVRYNVIKKQEEILIPRQSFSMDNEANASLAWLMSECALFNYPTDKVQDFLTYIADENLYNPVTQWITSKPWDGVSRIQAFYGTITSSGASSLKETLMKRWMISAIAAAFNPNGIAAQGMLVLQGAQNLGKTKWFKKLVPSEFRLLKDGMILRPDDKDSVKQVCSFWLVELGELDATFRKADIASLKAFITKDSDTLRLPYARKESNFARRTVFFGSVNPREYLHDATGNRRYWTVECEYINHEHTLDMQQIWAEFYELYKSGEGYYLTAQENEMLNQHNEEFTAIDPIEEALLGGLDWDSPQTLWRWAQSLDILRECGIDRPTARDCASAGSLLKKMNNNQFKTVKGKRLVLCPNKVFGV